MVSYLVVGLDVQLDLFAGQGADSVWVVSAGARRGRGLLVAFAYLICMLASRCVRVGGVLGKSVVGMESWGVLVLCLKTAARCLKVEGQAVTWVSRPQSSHPCGGV